MRQLITRNFLLCALLIGSCQFLCAQSSVDSSITSTSGSEVSSSSMSSGSVDASLNSSVDASGAYSESGGGRARNAGAIENAVGSGSARGGADILSQRNGMGFAAGRGAEAGPIAARYGRETGTTMMLHRQRNGKIMSNIYGSLPSRKAQLAFSHFSTGEASGAGKQGLVAAESSGSYVAGLFGGGFPDSTRGTALVSPPDTGTQSPLDWAPKLSFELSGLPDHFLKPTFLVGAEHAGGHNRSSRMEKYQGNQAQSYSPSLTIDQPGGLLAPPSSQSSFESPLDELNGGSSLDPSIGQE